MSSGSASGIIFRKSTSPMDVLDASRSRPDVFSKLYCGYSTPARSGTCCRKAIRTTEAFVKSWVPRNPVIRVLRKFCIGLPSEPYRWVKGLMRLRCTDSDGLTDAPLAEMIDCFKKSGKVGCFIAID